MTDTIDHEYVLGTQSDELDRLQMQHELWADAARAQWRIGGFGSGQTLIDLGCGPGFATRELAGIAGAGGKVIGVDVSKRFLEHAKVYANDGNDAGVEMIHADAQDVSIGEGIADGLYSRWVLSFTPEPERVIGHISRAMKPGGTVVIQDYVSWASLLWAPMNETLGVLRRSIMSMYEAQNADSSVGQKLPSMLVRHGFEIREVRPLHRIARPGEPLWKWPTVFFRTFLPKVVEAGHMTQSEFERWDAEWRELERTPGAFFMTPPQVEIIADKTR